MHWIFCLKKLDTDSIRCQSNIPHPNLLGWAGCQANILPPVYAILLVGSGAHLIYCTRFYIFFGWIGCHPKIPAPVVCYFFLVASGANPIFPIFMVGLILLGPVLVTNFYGRLGFTGTGAGTLFRWSDYNNLPTMIPDYGSRSPNMAYCITNTQTSAQSAGPVYNGTLCQSAFRS